MTSSRRSIEIDAPIEKVWDLVMDPDRLGDWVTIHDSVSDVPDGDLEEGSRFRQSMKLKGVPLKVNWEVVECDAPNRARWRGEAAAGAKARIVYELSEEDGDDHLRLRERVRAAGRQGGQARRHARSTRCPGIARRRSRWPS